MANDNYDAEVDELEITDLDDKSCGEEEHGGGRSQEEAIRQERNWRRQRRQRLTHWTMGSICAIGLIILGVLLWPDARQVFNARAGIATPVPTSGIISQIVASNGISYIMTNVPHQLSASLEAVKTSNGKHLWEHPVGTGLQQELVQDTLYLYSEAGVDAINSKNGRLRWSQNLDQLQGTPLVQDGVVYVAYRRGMDALRVQDGSVIWHQDDIGLILRSGGGMLYTRSTDNSSVYALHQSDGTIQWHNVNVKSAQLSLNQSKSQANDLYITDESNTSFGALDPTTGRPLWQWQYEVQKSGEEFLQENAGYNITQIAAAADGSISAPDWHVDNVGKIWLQSDSTLYVASVRKQTLRAINAESGALQWQRNEPADLIGAGGSMLYSSNRSGAGIAGIRARDGVESWHVDSGKLVFIDASSGMVYLQDAGMLKALSARDGHILWQMQASPSVSIADSGTVNVSGINAVYLNQRASASDTSGQIMLLRTDNGDVLWSSQKNVTLVQEQDGSSYLRIAMDGMIVVVEDKSGNVRWHYQVKGAKGE